MSHNLLAVVVGLGLGLFIFGCGRNDSTISPVPVAPAAAAPVPAAPAATIIKDDPAASFQAFSDGFVKKAVEMCNDSWAANVPPARPSDEYSMVNEHSIDVEKTNSLMSPFLGTIKMEMHTFLVPPANLPDYLKSDMIEGRVCTVSDVTVTFAAQNNQWVLKSARASDHDKDTSRLIEPFLAKVYASIAK